MSKAIKLKDLYVGQLITRGKHEEAQIYTIAEIKRIDVLLKWKEGSHDCQRWSDYSDCYVPKIKQLEYSTLKLRAEIDALRERQRNI